MGTMVVDREHRIVVLGRGDIEVRPVHAAEFAAVADAFQDSYRYGREHLDDIVAAESPRRSLYLDIAGYLAAQKKDSVPFTPAVPAVYGLEAALDELLDEGLNHRQATYRARVGLLDAAFTRMELEPSVAEAVKV